MVLDKPQPPTLEDGIHWNADRLERKKVADYLTPLVESITQPFVISLASDYGTGKTFFVKCWRKDLEAKGLACVYFNAWETDFSQDPLFAFIAAMKRELAPLTGADEKFNEAAKKTGGLIAKKVGVIATKALLRAGLGTDAARDVLDLANIDAGDVVEAAGKYAEERLRAQESAEKSMAEFKVYLAATVEELVANKNPPHKKIVVFVDDLDRCRPDYAVSILECIKHLFSVRGLVFVLSIDDNQLSQAVKAVYGPSIDSDGYLRKFIDWNFRLPKPSVFQFIDFLLHSSGLHEIFSKKPDTAAQAAPEFVRVFAEFSSALGFSLRKIEQVFTELNLTLRSVEQRFLILADRFAVVACLRHISGEKFSLHLNDKQQIIEYVTRYVPSLEFRVAESRFVKMVDALPFWFTSLEGFDEIWTREKAIERRLGQIHEARLANRSSSETLAQERQKLIGEGSEIQLVSSTLSAANSAENRRDLTFFDFIFRQLDATAYIYSPRK
jgi:hypothetical protein